MDINCPICYDQYNDKDKIPRILHCGHTFCQISTFCFKAEKIQISKYLARAAGLELVYSFSVKN